MVWNNPSMASYVALIRGLNVGTRTRIRMEPLKELAGSCGWASVTTYLQSGNLVFESASSATRCANDLSQALTSQFSVPMPVVVLTAAQVRTLVTDNPYPQVTDHRQLHALVLARALQAEELAAVHSAVDKARARGSNEEVEPRGQVVYLNLPDGMGRSIVVPFVTRAAKVLGEGTARNWATMTYLNEAISARG